MDHWLNYYLVQIHMNIKGSCSIQVQYMTWHDHFHYCAVTELLVDIGKNGGNSELIMVS